MTAVISVVTAISLWPLLPRVLALPGPGQLRKMNTQLAAEIAEKNAAQVNLHQAYHQVEAQVVDRTRESQELNQRRQEPAAICASCLKAASIRCRSLGAVRSIHASLLLLRIFAFPGLPACCKITDSRCACG